MSDENTTASYEISDDEAFIIYDEPLKVRQFWRNQQELYESYLDKSENFPLEATQPPDLIEVSFGEDESKKAVSVEVFKSLCSNEVETNCLQKSQSVAHIPLSLSQESHNDVDVGKIPRNQAARRGSCEPSNNKAVMEQRPNSLEEAIEMLKNLSVLIDEKEKLQLLSSLANVLCRDNSSAFIPNAHSSFNTHCYQEPEYQCYEALDLRKKHPSESNLHTLDVSPNLNHRAATKMRHSRSFQFPAPRIVPHFMSSNQQASYRSTTDMSRSSASGISNVSSASQFSAGPKLKLKKSDQQRSRGPLKAMVPVGSMAKLGEPAMTPNNMQTSHRATKKTPTNVSSQKPLLQSTPTGATSSQNTKHEWPISPVDSSTNNLSEKSTGRSRSISSLKRASHSPPPKASGRRHSATSLTTETDRRSKGLIDRVKSNVASTLKTLSPRRNKADGAAPRPRSEKPLAEKNRRSLPTKMAGLVSKTKKTVTGKENLYSKMKEC